MAIERREDTRELAERGVAGWPQRRRPSCSWARVATNSEGNPSRRFRADPFQTAPRTAFERWTAFRGTMPDATAYGVEGRVSRRPTLRSRMTERWLSHRSPRWHDTADPATTRRAGLFDLQVDLEQDQRPQGDRQSRRSDVGEAVHVREIIMLLGNHHADDHVNQRDDSSHSHSHSHKTTPLASGPVFGNQNVGTSSAAQSVMLSNTGSGDLV